MKKVLAALALGSAMILSGCPSGNKGSNQHKNHSPFIDPIPVQTVDEGEKLSFSLSGYIHDEDGDQLEVTVLDGPGNIKKNEGDFVYTYKDRKDGDTDDDSHSIILSVDDARGGVAEGSFSVVQHDILPPKLQVERETLTSGLEALIIDEWGGFHEEGYRREQIAVGVRKNGQPIIIYQDLSTGIGIHSLEPLTEDVWVKRQVHHFITGSYLSLLVDDHDNFHMVLDSNQGAGAGEDLFYFRKLGSQFWNFWDIDESASVGLENDLVLGSNGKVHISHFSWAHKKVKYSTSMQGGWVNEELQPADWNQISIALDQGENPNIAYVSGNNIYHLVKAGTSWTQHHVDDGQNPVMRTDSSGLLHLVYEKSGYNPSLHHAAFDGTIWSKEQIANHPGSTLLSGNKLSMAMAPNNSMHIVYVMDGRQLYYTTNQGSGWWAKNLDSRGGWGNPSIDVDDRNAVHLAVPHDGQVKYITFDPSILEK